MYTTLSVAIGVGLLVLGFRYVNTFLARRRLMHLRACTNAPQVADKSPDLAKSFKSVYNKKREEGKAVHFIQEILFDQPGRTVVVDVDKQPWLFTSDVDNIKTMLAQNESMIVEPLRKGMLKGWVGDGMFGSDGEHWRISRALFKPMFSRAPVSELAQWEKHTERFLSNLPADGVTVDLAPMLKRLYFDASMETLIGESANSQAPEYATYDVDKFEADFEQVMIGAYLKFVELNPGKVDKSWQDKCNFIHSIFDGYIVKAVAERQKTGKASNASMLHNLIEFSQDKVFLRDQLINVFLGAKDTAGIGIANVIFFLARHPRVYQKLREEIAQIGSKPLTFELLKSMKYLQSVIAESLRIHSPVNIVLRLADKDCVLPRGGGPDGQQPILVDKNTRLEASLAALHREPRFWGEDTEAFQPERWGSSLAPKWEYAPFAGGARMCPAQQLILTQYAYLLVRIAQRYSKIENRDPVEEFVAQVIFSQQSKNGVKVAFYH